MHKIRQDFLIDERGTTKAVVVPFSEWQKIERELEELDDICADDKAKAKPSKQICFEQAVKEIRESRKR